MDPEPKEEVKPTDAANAIADIGEKKRPGRPKKDKVDTQLKFHGVQEQPQLADDIMELVYDSPQIFKKIIQIFTSYRASEIELIFDRNGVKMYAQDHSKQSSIYVTLDGRGMNHYFCREPLRICVKCSLLDAVFQTIGKSHYKIMFICRGDHRSKLYCVTSSSTHDNNKTYDIPVVINPANTKPQDDDSDYPIKFTLTASGFKDLINPKLGTSLTIEKKGNDPLQLVYDKVNQLGCVDRYPAGDKINLESTIEPNDIFSSTVSIKNVQSFATKNIGSTVQICAHKTKPISFTSISDRKDNITVATVKVFTNLK